MLKENLSLIQLLALVFIFLLGSSIVMGIGLEAGTDSWIAIILATLTGTGIMYFYYSINRLLPDKNLFEILEYCFTRPVAIFLSFGYIIYFLYIACRVTRDAAELTSSAILTITPIEIIILSFMLVIAYIVYLGLEVLGRVAEIFIPYLVGFLFLFIIFLFASGRMEFHNIQPVLGEGFKPIMKALFPSLISFPFGELIVFTVILSSVTDFQKSKKFVLLGVLLAGCFLTIGSLLMLFALGAEAMQFKSFPLLTAARRISVGQFIERLDALVVFIMMLGVLVKSSIFLYTALKGLEYIFQIPYRYFAVPISMSVSIYSNVISFNFAEFKEEGLKFALYYIHPPMQVVVPTIVLLILFWKTKKHNSRNIDNQH